MKSGIARRRLNPDPVKKHLATNAAVRHTVERDPLARHRFRRPVSSRTCRAIRNSISSVTSWISLDCVIPSLTWGQFISTSDSRRSTLLRHHRVCQSRFQAVDAANVRIAAQEMCSQATSRGASHETQDGGSDLRRRPGFHNARVGLGKDFRNHSPVGGDDWQVKRHGFDQDQAKAFRRVKGGKTEAVAFCQQRPFLLATYKTVITYKRF